MPESDEVADKSSYQQEYLDSADQASATEAYINLETGLMAGMFNRYMSVDADVQMSADSSDEELLASVTTAQSAGDQANDDESPSDDDAVNDDAEVANDSTHAETCAMALHSLDSLRAYLESVGWDAYENLYNLVDQVHNICKQCSEDSCRLYSK